MSEQWIEKAEVRLGVLFPPSYRWWLRNYKGGEINGCEIFSVYELDFDSVVGGDVVYQSKVYQNGNLLSEYFFDGEG